MGPRTRCPVCSRFGSDELGGYCTPCHSKRKKKKKSVFDDFPGFATDKPFIPEKFGIMKDKFDLER